MWGPDLRSLVGWGAWALAGWPPTGNWVSNRVLFDFSCASEKDSLRQLDDFTDIVRRMG
jgi:hypothetical protein